MRVAVRVPATTANLGPGFDAFGAAVDLHLWAGIVERADVRVETTGEGEGELPAGDDNLVWRAFTEGCRRFEVEAGDVSLRVHSRIPLERGLGSSAAAIVAGLGLARARAGRGVADRVLVDLAADLEGHPDNVAPAVLGGLVIAAPGAQHRPVLRRARPAPRLRPLLCVPRERQGTTEARAVLPDSLSRADAAAQAARAGHLVGALTGVWAMDPEAAGDLLHEPARLAIMPGSRSVLERLRAAGVHAWLSGAGPTVAAAVAARGQAPDPGDDRFEPNLRSWDLGGLVTCTEGACAWSGDTRCLQCPRDAV